MILVSCNRTIQHNNRCENVYPTTFPYYSEINGVSIEISDKVDFKTKVDDADYFQITGTQENVRYSVILENIYDGDFMFQNHYSETGEHIATLTYYKDEIALVELTPALETTKGFLDEYVSCVKSEYVRLRDNTEENNPILNDFSNFGRICALVTAVVQCAK